MWQLHWTFAIFNFGNDNAKKLLLGLQIDSVPFLSDLKVYYKMTKLVAMGNRLLSNIESVCKFFFYLSRIFLQELLHFLVFELFRLNFFGQKGQNHHSDITVAAFYTFYVSLHLLLRLRKSFRFTSDAFFFMYLKFWTFIWTKYTKN